MKETAQERLSPPTPELRRRKSGHIVSAATAACTVAFNLFTILRPAEASSFFAKANRFFNVHFTWVYVLVINAVLIFVVWLCCSRYGEIRLGGPLAKPEFGNGAW